MAAIVLLVTLHLFDPSSLKQKRGVVRPLVERLRRQLSVSVAEVGMHDELRRSQIGLALVAPDLVAASPAPRGCETRDRRPADRPR